MPRDDGTIFSCGIVCTWHMAMNPHGHDPQPQKPGCRVPSNSALFSPPAPSTYCSLSSFQLLWVYRLPVWDFLCSGVAGVPVSYRGACLAGSPIFCNFRVPNPHSALASWEEMQGLGDSPIREGRAGVVFQAAPGKSAL